MNGFWKFANVICAIIYIIAARIREAKRLLAHTDLSVGEVGVRVGILDHNYFTKFFRDNVGMAPLRYRKEAGGGE